MGDQRGVRVIALRLGPALHGPLDAIPVSTDRLPLARVALVLSQCLTHLHQGGIDTGLQGGAPIRHVRVAAEQHGGHAAMLLGQLNQARQGARQRCGDQLALRSLDGAVELAGEGQHQAGEGKEDQQPQHTELDRIAEPVHQQFGGGKQQFHGTCPDVTWHSTAPFDVVALRTRRLAKARLRVATERAEVAAQNTEPTERSP